MTTKPTNVPTCASCEYNYITTCKKTGKDVQDYAVRMSCPHWCPLLEEVDPPGSHLTPGQYLGEVLKTENIDFVGISNRCRDEMTLRILHGVCGIANESGEIMEAVKKYLFYGKPLDNTNLVEELGDLLWYIGITIDALGSSFEEVMEKNVKKLRARYKKGKFDAEDAEHRNLDKEREALE